VTLHDDQKEVEHGFASVVPRAAGGVSVVWLDGREMDEASESGDMTLRYAEVDSNGKVKSSVVADPRVCDCCATAATMTSNGMVVAYRDRSVDETRDISVVRKSEKGWSSPVDLHRDGWMIKGCPVNGPQLDALGSRVVAAWFTAADERPRVNVAFSSDGGAHFGKVFVVDLGHAEGRVEVVQTDQQSAIVFWMEKIGAGVSVMSRRVWSSGKQGEATAIGSLSASRSSGFPRAVRIGKSVYVAWTDDVAKRIRLAALRLD
jgi:hypothetical protein